MREISGVIKSAKRVLELFEFFAECRHPLSVTDVVRGLNYPQSSASALLKSLARLGYLDYDRHSRLFAPTLRMALLGSWVQDALFSKANLSLLMDDLHESSGALMVILGMQNEVFVQYIHMVQSPRHEILKWYVKPGALRPLFRSAIGRVLLSRKSDAEIQQLLWRVNAEEEPEHRLSLQAVLKELDSIRSNGFACTEGTVNPLGGVLAIEVPTPAGQRPMAIGIGDDIDALRENRERYLELLRAAVSPFQGMAVATRDDGLRDVRAG